MIIAIVGKSNSGKTTLAKELEERSLYKGIVSYTTRDPRPNEIDGKDYDFVSSEKFNDLELQGNLSLVKTFHVQKNDLLVPVRYGFLVPALWEAAKSSDPYYLLIDPRGLDELKAKYGKSRVKSIYLAVSHTTRFLRGIERGDDIKELYRRFDSDDRDFYDMEALADYIIPEKDQEQANLVYKVIQIMRNCHEA